MPIPTRPRDHDAASVGSGSSTAYFTALSHSLSRSPLNPFASELPSGNDVDGRVDVDGETFDNWRSSYYSTGLPPDFEVHSAAFKEFAEKTSRAWATGTVVRRTRTRKGKGKKRGVRRPGGGGSGGGKELRSRSRLRSAWYE